MTYLLKHHRKHRLMPITRVYRVGRVAPGDYDPTILDWFTKIDRFAPSDRMTRTGCVFAAPSPQALRRWLGARFEEFADGVDELLEVHEISVDADTVWTYLVPFYERIPLAAPVDSPDFARCAHRFWDSGITLSEWHSIAPEDSEEWGWFTDEEEEGEEDRRGPEEDWEVLLDPVVDILRSQRLNLEEICDLMREAGDDELAEKMSMASARFLTPPNLSAA